MKKLILSALILVMTGVFPVAAKPVSSSQTSLMNMKLTILYVIHRYLAPDRIDPSKMFLTALKAAAKETPEIMISQKGQTLSVHAGSKVLQISSRISSPLYLVGAFQNVFTFLKTNLPADVKMDSIENRMIAGMLETLDPHTNFLPPDVYKEMSIRNSGAFGGLGIVVAVCSGKLSVLKVLPGTPASRAKLKPGDSILKIGNQPTENLTLSEAVKRLRGEPATPVSVMIGRKSWRKPKKLSIMRESIAYDSVVDKVIPHKKGNIGYIKIRSFQIPTGNQVKKSILKLKQAGVKGMILDLRGNGGGLLRAAIEVTDFFLDSGTIVAQVAKNRDKNLRHERRANMGSTLYRGPLVVLIDDGSASASEIVAGSLKYSGRALVVGKRSFGKGSVQDVITYSSDAALKITVAQYLTYGDVSIQGRGIEPDIRVRDVEIDAKNRGRQVIYYTDGYESTTEASLKSSLKAARKKRKDKPMHTVYALAIPVKTMPFKCRYCGLDPDDPIKRSLEDFSEDAEINLSKAIITGFSAKKFSRKAALAKLGTILKPFNSAEDTKIRRKLKRSLKIDWRAGRSTDPRGTATFAVASPHFTTGAWADMSLTFKNTGKAPLYRVRAVANSTNPRLNFQELLFGYVRPGRQVTKRFAVKIPKGVSARSDNITFKFYSALKPLPVAARGKVVIKGSKLPQLALSYAFHDTKNSDGMLEPGEVGEFHVTVKNVGDGPTGEAKVMLKNLTGSEVSIEKSRADISNLKPGASVTAVFKVRALRLSGDLFWKFKLETTDCNYGNNVEIPWYVRRRSLKRTQKLSQSGSVVIKQDTVLFDTPWSKSQKPQRVVKKGRSIPVAFLLNKHYAVPTTTKGYYLFVPKGVVTKSTKVAAPVARASFNHTSPDIFLAEPALQVSNGRVLLTGKVADSDGIRDFYITVTNLKRRVYASKVHYESPKGAKRHSFKVNVPLTKGVNIITVTARDTRRASYSRNVVVYSSR